MPPNIPTAQSNPNLILQAHTREIRRDTFDLRILAAHPGTTLSNVPKFLVESNFANRSCSQILSPTDYCLPPHRPEAGWSEAELAARCRYYHLLSASGTSGQPALTLFRLLQKMKAKKDTIILYQPRIHPSHPFPPFAKENMRTIHTSIMASGQYSQTDPL